MYRERLEKQNEELKQRLNQCESYIEQLHYQKETEREINRSKYFVLACKIADEIDYRGNYLDRELRNIKNAIVEAIEGNQAPPSLKYNAERHYTQIVNDIVYIAELTKEDLENDKRRRDMEAQNQRLLHQDLLRQWGTDTRKMELF
jgi:hypothetical protein